MKKLLIICSAVLLATTTSFGQTVEEIFGKFENATKIGAIDKSKAENMSIKMTIDAQGMKMPITMIKSGADKMRMEMSAQGQNIVMVLNGDEGFMVIPGQGTQSIPAAAIKQQSQQGDVLSLFSFNKEENIFTLKGEEGDCYVVEEAKTKKPDKVTSTYYFNKSTGLLDKMKSRKDGVNSVFAMSDYKDFGGAMIPSVMNVEAQGQKVKMTIESLEFDFPVMPFMFAKPE